MKKLLKREEFFHSWYLLVITIFSVLFLLLNRNLYLGIPLVIGSFYLYFKNGLTLKKFFRFSLYALFFGMSYFLLSRLHPGKDATMEKSIHTMIRLFTVTLVSMSSGSVINYTNVVLHLIVHKGLKLFWGYPLLLALNSIALFKEEYDRIKINAKLRDLPMLDKIMVFFPLLVFAIRHSQRGALSLVTRGLTKEKSFYFSYDVSRRDKKILLIFWLIYLLLVGLAIFPIE